MGETRKEQQRNSSRMNISKKINSIPGDSCSDHDHDDHGAHFDETNLPSEQDRKATLGCLAAVLNIMFEHQSHHHPHTPTSLTTSSSKGGVGLSSLSLKERKSTTTARSGGGDDVLVFGASERRTREFQEELLQMSCQLLYLPSVHAIEFLPILENRNEGKSNHIVDNNAEDNIIGDASSASEYLLLEPFLSSFSNDRAGFHCISLLLFRFLLLSHNENYEEKDAADGKNNLQNLSTKPKTIIGYDSRVRHAFKYASVSILNFLDPVYGRFGGVLPYVSTAAGRKSATRKYEALEDAIAHRISIISKHIILEGNKSKKQNERESSSKTMKTKAIKKKSQIVRGIKIGTAAIGAGALIAISGGIAVPAIVGGIAAAAGITALSFGTLTAISLLVLPAAVTIFGVGSGVLVAGKMSNRTKGLTDFDIQPAAVDSTSATTERNAKKKKDSRVDQDQQQQECPKLTRTICINGWIDDEHDFERPFGMAPKSLRSKSELLKRYCSVYEPQVIPSCDDILKEWKSKEDELWKVLRDAYGKNPDTLYPLESSSMEDIVLTKDEYKSIDSVMRTIMGIQPDLRQILEEEIESTMKKGNKNDSRPLHKISLLGDVLNTTKKKRNVDDGDDVLKAKKHRSFMAWDFQSTYRGTELYTVSWEQELLLQLRGSAKDLQKDLAMKGAEQVMKKTALASLMTAVAIPSALLGLANFIDEKWIIANERADEAGILLAESLLMSTAGHRPINLIGISFGSRMIISCLTELSRHQREWEKQQHNTLHSRRGSFGLLKAGDVIIKGINDSVKSKLGKGTDLKKSDSITNESRAISYLREPASIIENVILMGCPATVKPSTWKSIRSVVAGPLINCYAGNDLMLALMYRIKNPATALLNPPVGITEVKDCGVTNYDVSSLINSSHSDYCLLVKDILDLVGFDQPKGGGHLESIGVK